MKKIALAIISLMCCVGAAFAQEEVDYVAKASEQYNTAIAKLQAKEYSAAIPVLKEAVNMALDAGGDNGISLAKDIRSTLIKAYFAAGNEAGKNKQYDESIKHFTDAEKLADLNNDVRMHHQAARMVSAVYMAKGIESFNNKEFQTALDVFELGYKQDSSNMKLANFTAKAYGELGRLQDAVNLYNKVVTRAGEDSRYAEDAKEAQADMNTYVLPAISEAAQAGDLDKALTLADLIPASPQAALLVMQSANNAKKYDVVIARGDAAAALQSEAAQKSEILYFIGSAFQNKGNNAKAIEYFSKVTDGPLAATAKGLVVELKK